MHYSPRWWSLGGTLFETKPRVVCLSLYKHQVSLWINFGANVSGFDV